MFSMVNNCRINYNIIKENELKKILEFKRVDTDFSSHKRYWENFEQENDLIALNILFVFYLLMIIDETNNYYYFSIKNLPELNSLGWLQGKKEAIIDNNNNNHDNNNNNFQNALDDALNHQINESNPERISKLKPYINKYNWKGINFPAGSKEWQTFE